MAKILRSNNSRLIESRLLYVCMYILDDKANGYGALVFFSVAGSIVPSSRRIIEKRSLIRIRNFCILGKVLECCWSFLIW